MNIIDTLSQTSGGPIAFRISNLFICLVIFYLVIYLYVYFLTSLRKICEYP